MIIQTRIKEFGDFWNNNDIRPIHVKEATELLNSLSLVWIGFKTKELTYIHNSDNQAVVCAWNNQSAKDPSLNSKRFFSLLLK
jgi:hypothetical protein